MTEKITLSGAPEKSAKNSATSALRRRISCAFPIRTGALTSWWPPTCPTYTNRTEQGGTNSITGAIGKAGADFKRAFTPDSYRRFLEAAGYTDAHYTLASGGPYCDCGYKKKGFVPQN